MFIMRVDCKSGLHIEFAYDDIESANDYAVKLLAQDAPAVVLVCDVHGRASWIKPSEVIHTMVSDIAIEQGEMARQSLEIQKIQSEAALDWKRNQGAKHPPVVQARPTVLGPNGQIINSLGGMNTRR